MATTPCAFRSDKAKSNLHYVCSLKIAFLPQIRWSGQTAGVKHSVEIRRSVHTLSWQSHSLALNCQGTLLGSEDALPPSRILDRLDATLTNYIIIKTKWSESFFPKLQGGGGKEWLGEAKLGAKCPVSTFS